MKPEIWSLFDKKGSNLNLTADPYLNMIISTDVGKDAKGFAITDPSGLINRTHIINGGINYDTNTQIFLDYIFDNTTVFPVDTSIFYKDVSIFNPNPISSSSISQVNIVDNSTNFIYPSVSYIGALFLDPVSKGLIETEHILILQKDASLGFITPYDSSNSTLKFKMVGDEEQIKFFTIDENTQEIIWANEIIMDVSSYVINQGLQLNIGFRSDDEGVYERRMVVYHSIGESDYPLIEIIINAQSIGQDERFDTIIDNLGLFKPKSIEKVFKESDINEDMPDWKLINYKAKHIILDHSKIMPYIGTYKGLINTIKWLGYEDIQVKEWFKNVKENSLLSLYVPYDADERKKTIKYFSPDERKNLKKLNQLSLVYCITRETGVIDEWGNPLTENCYEYNLNEILVKLYSLKTWLEQNIIGVNARIYDLTGEGVYFERFQNIIYGTQNYGSVAIYEESLTPIPLSINSELINGEASINLSLKEYGSLTIGDLQFSAIDAARYGWDPSNGFFSPEEYYNLSYIDPSAVFIGSPLAAPFKDLYDIQWRISVEKQYGVLTTKYVTNPLFIYDNQIRFYNIFDVSTLFDTSINLDITIEKAYLRDPSIDVWGDSIAYTIYQDQDASGTNTGKWIYESSIGNKLYTWGEFSLQTTSNSILQYAYDTNYKVPLLSLNNFIWTDASGNNQVLNTPYYLDMVNGKIAIDSSTQNINGDILDVTNYINFNYDTSLNEQKITLNVIYTSPRMPVFMFDPSDASTMYYNPDASIAIYDNSTYKMLINHAGQYNIEVFGWNGQNNLFFNYYRNEYDVWQKYPKINSFIDTSCASNIVQSCVSTYMSINDVSILINENLKPLFDRYTPLQGLTLEYDIEGKPFIKVPSITYFQDIPENGSIAKFFNLTERITSIAGSDVVIDSDYQNFYVGDIINIIHFDKGQYNILSETSSNITANPSYYTLGTVPSNFNIDSSTEWYVLNETERDIFNASNDFNLNEFTCDVSGYAFRYNQVVSILTKDLSTGYTFGSALRVLDVSNNVHKLQGNIPDFVINNSRYKLTAKHSFSRYADFEINISEATETNNEFNLYLDDKYFHQYYLDNTFVFLNLQFNQERVLQQWYDPSDNLINKEFYPFNHSIQLDVSTLVIFKAEYDNSTYMLDQKNIWEIKNSNGELIMRVFNNSVPYIFNELGLYDVKCQSYDKYGNLKEQNYEGLIVIK